MLQSVQEDIRAAVSESGYSEDVYELLKEPSRTLEVRIPVRMDNGKVSVFNGYRAQHSDVSGPTKGGVLFHPEVCEERVKALSVRTGLKAAVLHLPFGGARGGISCDPRALSFRELERLCRGYIRAVGDIIGPATDILEPDVMTNTQIMAWMMDEYHYLYRDRSANAVTGKPLLLGGLDGLNEAAAKGVTLLIREAARKKGMEIRSAKVIVQGFGSAGSCIAKILSDEGASIVGISDAYGALYNPSGLAVNELLDRRDSFGTVTKLFSQTLTNQELLEKPCDILVLAAIENQITKKNAPGIKAKVITEAVRQSVSGQAAEILTDRGGLLIPEILATAGDMIASYFEWVQNSQGTFWNRKDTDARLEQTLRSAFSRVYETAGDRGITMQQAANLVAVQKLADSARYRGWI
ncbi:Glu/Leu/Phe/Val dehydrogenase [Sporolactobacillus sp. THM7-7]|nr:Glu/Leu/Phe/Val dehydrogenase [Sporolactobacillus sp. THM7-7]